MAHLFFMCAKLICINRIHYWSDMMKITSILAQKKNCNRYDIYIDYKYAFSADFDEVIKYGLKEDIYFSEEEFKTIISEIQYKNALNTALRFLNVKSRTENEVRKKLSRNDYDNYVIDRVILRLKELGYLDDYHYTKLYIEDRMNLKPLGKKKLSIELKNKGVDPDIIEKVIDESSYDDLDTAIQLVKKRINRIDISQINKDDIEKLYNRLYRYLLYRGILYETAKKAINICINCDIENYTKD